VHGEFLAERVSGFIVEWFGGCGDSVHGGGWNSLWFSSLFQAWMVMMVMEMEMMVMVMVMVMVVWWCSRPTADGSCMQNSTLNDVSAVYSTVRLRILMMMKKEEWSFLPVSGHWSWGRNAL
jgi:hypothetical protein